MLKQATSRHTVVTPDELYILCSTFCIKQIQYHEPQQIVVIFITVFGIQSSRYVYMFVNPFFYMYMDFLITHTEDCLYFMLIS